MANIFRRVLPIYLMSMRFSNINRWQWWWRSRDGYFWQMRWYQYPSRYRAFGRDRDRRLLSFPQNLSDDEGKSQRERTKLCLVQIGGSVCVFYNIWGSCKFIKGVSAKRVCEWVSQVWSKKKQCWQFSRKLSSPLNWLSDYMHIRVCAHFILIFILSPQLTDFQFVCTVCSSSS